MKKLKFIIIDENLEFRNAFKAFLLDQYDAVIIGEASNAKDLPQIKGIIRMADIIFIDLMMTNKSGIALAKELLWFYHHSLKIIAITMQVEKVYLITLIEAGFKGCIFKNELPLHCDKALYSVLSGGFYFPDEIQFGYVNRLEY